MKRKSSLKNTHDRPIQGLRRSQIPNNPNQGNTFFSTLGRVQMHNPKPQEGFFSTHFAPDIILNDIVPKLDFIDVIKMSQLSNKFNERNPKIRTNLFTAMYQAAYQANYSQLEKLITYNPEYFFIQLKIQNKDNSTEMLSLLQYIFIQNNHYLLQLFWESIKNQSKFITQFSTQLNGINPLNLQPFLSAHQKFDSCYTKLRSNPSQLELMENFKKAWTNLSDAQRTGPLWLFLEYYYQKKYSNHRDSTVTRNPKSNFYQPIEMDLFIQNRSDYPQILEEFSHPSSQGSILLKVNDKLSMLTFSAWQEQKDCFQNPLSVSKDLDFYNETWNKNFELSSICLQSIQPVKTSHRIVS